MKLTAENIKNTMMASLFTDEEVPDKNNPPPYIPSRGVMMSIAFHPERLEAQRDNVRAMLAQLDDAFMHDKGGGASMIHMVQDANGVLYGSQQDADALFMLAQALNLAAPTLPREYWGSLPGAMPYITITL